MRSSPQQTGSGTLFAHLDFVLTGMVMTLLGPILPVLSARWGLNDMQAGVLLFAQFASSILGMLSSGPLVERVGYRLTMMVGLVLMAIGVATLATATWTIGLIAVCVFGIGFGTNTPATNLFVAETNPARRASALNLLNSSWGVGAMGCPLVLALAQRSHRVPWFLYALAAALLLLTLSMSRALFAADVERSRRARVSSPTPTPSNYRLIPLIAAVFFVYVGTENSVGGWVASYARRVDPGSQMIWALTPSFFWGALLVGRALAPLALRRRHETRVALGGVSLAAAGVAMLLLAKTMLVVVVSAGITGFGLSSVFPINVSLLPHWFSDAATKLSGTIFSLGNLGGAALPWLVGAVSTRFGSLRLGLFVPLAGALLMILFYLSQSDRACAQN